MNATASAVENASRALSLGARPAKAGFSLGKYREVVVAVALFLIFDLGVLVLNFYISFQISEDATAINLAGRQRMLSQRTTKAIYAVEDRLATSGNLGDDGKELEAAVKLFDTTLRAFRDGGTVTGGDGKPVQLEAVNAPKGREAIEKTQALWLPLLEKTNALLLPNPGPDLVKDIVAYARTNNTTLLARMNDLTTALEQDAADRAARLRLVQTVGIVLALLNFVFILFKFIRSLRRADETAELVANENREILASVREGLFLVTPELRVGTQIAKASHDLFGKPVHPGELFLQVLEPLVTEKVLLDTKDYLDLLFSPHVKEQLVQSINPLSDVEIITTNRLGKAVVRHLSFAFNRSVADGKVSQLLVTVQDITERKELEAALQQQKQGAQREFSMMLKALETDAGELGQFVTRSEQDLLEVNKELRNLSSSNSPDQFKSMVRTAFRQVHTFKGEAQSLGLEILSVEAEKMEQLLENFRSSEEPAQDQVLQLPIILESLLAKLSIFKDIASKQRAQEQAKPPIVTHVATPTNLSTPAQGSAPLHAQLTLLAAQIAKDTGKTVNLAVDLQALSQWPIPHQQALKDIVIQLLRNAVVHGIEASTQRLQAGKSASGNIRIQLKSSDGQWQLSVHDDGAGLNLARLRERLIQLAWYTPEQVQRMDDRQVIAHIFKAGFSTASAPSGQADASSHAGRGVGLDVVQAQAKSIGAALGLSFIPGQFTEFKLRLAQGVAV